jgi:hypothetical protein
MTLFLYCEVSVGSVLAVGASKEGKLGINPSLDLKQKIKS